MALEPARITDFAIAGTLGSGATARVFEATHIASGRPVAIKVLEPGAQVPELRERFAREALLLSNIKSRHIGQILGFGFERGQPFLVLERLRGETLDAKLRRDGPVRPPSSLDWIEQLLVGVRDVHAANVVHRDLKPANIFLLAEAGREIVKVIDFGIARLNDITQGGHGLTSPNHLLGSMGYMAPEAFRSARAVGFGTDLYAVGVVVFRMVSGHLPFVSRSLEALIRMKTERDAPLLSTIEGAPQFEELDWFVARALAREPQSRFQTAREMLEAWAKVRVAMTSPRPRPRPVGDYDVEDLVTNVDGRAKGTSAKPTGEPPTTHRQQIPTETDSATDTEIPVISYPEDVGDDGTTARRDAGPVIREHQARLAAGAKAMSGVIPRMPRDEDEAREMTLASEGVERSELETSDIELVIDDEPLSMAPNSGHTVVQAFSFQGEIPSVIAEDSADDVDTKVNNTKASEQAVPTPPPATKRPAPSTLRTASLTSPRSTAPRGAERKKVVKASSTEVAPKTIASPFGDEGHPPVPSTQRGRGSMYPPTTPEITPEPPPPATTAGVDLGELVKAALERQRALKKKRG